MKLFSITFLFFCLYSYSSELHLDGVNQETDSLSHYYKLANNPQKNSDLPLAYKFYLNQKEQSLARKDTLNAINILRQIAIIENNLGDYFSSESSVVEALKLLDKMEGNDFVIQSKIGLYNQLGRIYKVLLDFDSALRYYNEALKIAKSQKNINIIQNNKALVHEEQENYELAEKELVQVYNNSIQLEDQKQVARAMDNLGFIQSKLNRPEGLKKIIEALEIRKEISDKTGIYSSYRHLSDYYKDRNDLQKAFYYADMGYQTAKSINSVSYIENALSRIIKLSPNPRINEFLRLTDSISQAKQISENKYALIKYNYLQQAKLTAESELQKEKEKRMKLIYQAIGILILLLSFFFYYFLRDKYKKEKIQQVYKTETRISKRIHDEVANDVYQVMTKAQQNPDVSEDVIDDLEHIYTKTRDISKDNSTIAVKTNFEDTLNELLLNYRSEGVGIVTKGLTTINWNYLSDIQKTTIYRVLQELMTNMKKHSSASVVAITASKIKNRVHINYKDNGVGCNLKKQVGLQNTETRMASIKGTITFDSEPNKGFNAKIIV